jgi:hypothetical protein
MNPENSYLAWTEKYTKLAQPSETGLPGVKPRKLFRNVRLVDCQGQPHELNLLVLMSDLVRAEEYFEESVLDFVQNLEEVVALLAVGGYSDMNKTLIVQTQSGEIFLTHREHPPVKIFNCLSDFFAAVEQSWRAEEAQSLNQMTQEPDEEDF